MGFNAAVVTVAKVAFPVMVVDLPLIKPRTCILSCQTVSSIFPSLSGCPFPFFARFLHQAVKWGYSKPTQHWRRFVSKVCRINITRKSQEAQDRWHNVFLSLNLQSCPPPPSPKRLFGGQEWDIEIIFCPLWFIFTNWYTENFLV